MSEASTKPLEILIPTYRRAMALAATLTGLFGQTFRGFDVIIADQTPDNARDASGELTTLKRAFENRGQRVAHYRCAERRGMAEQRHFLLDQASAPYVLFLDDDLLLEPEVVGRMLDAIREQGCGVPPSGVYHLELPTKVPNRQHNTDDLIRKYLGTTTRAPA